jgi:hypothetical protein
MRNGGWQNSDGSETQFHGRLSCSKVPAMSETSRLAPFHMIGGGLAGNEAAKHIARHNIRAVPHEKRRLAQPRRIAPATSLISQS